MKSIDRYMARLIALPLISTLVIAAMLLVLDRMLRLFDFVATQGGPISVVWKMLANLLPEYLGLGIPIGLLLGILLAFRRLATSSELDVMRGVGMSYGRLLRVPFMYAAVLAALNIAIVGYVQPKARYAYEQLRFDLRTGALGASIKVGEFTHLGDRMTLRIERSREKGRKLSGIFVEVNTPKGDKLAVTADSGQFLATDDPNVIIFRLTNGTLVHDRAGFRVPRVLTFSAHDLPIDLPKFESFRVRGGRNLEYTLPELAVLGKTAGSEQARDSSRAEFHFRLAEVASMFLMPLLGVALGVPPKRSTSALGVFLSIVMIVTYHKVNQYAAAFGELGRVDPFIALWVPFAIFAGLVFWMFYTLAYVPGGQPIGALERVSGKAVAAIMRYLPGARRKRAEFVAA
ncbi:LPS export ABC transporter permease LptF [Sphingomonas sp. SUN019]|uniref:LPS export ABC transporter permease LptF n=1 Tax=Sphingomonas sp. SUN019 TaxID=2937788 RepID=UPI0021643388|nr:LPS export ABC transporter permease LptF [Sphingomonas sp. SUN019]UVO51653.1 LPS export ABC transporter permease LptF [Sphingomonas sp. SUN019]